MISKTIEIWEEELYKSEEPGFKPTMDTYVLSGEKKRPAVIICPGGGYAYTSLREAEPIAAQFNSAGFHAFVLYYSVAPNKHPKPILDLSRAVCIIRDNADEWNVDADKIVVCGFSAGGHLAASLGVYWKKDYLEQVPGIKIGKNKPNALILAYPVITSGEFAHKGSFENLLGKEASKELLEEMSLEKHINENTPPSFIWHTFEDASVPVENSLFFAQEMRKKIFSLKYIFIQKGHMG